MNSLVRNLVLVMFSVAAISSADAAGHQCETCGCSSHKKRLVKKTGTKPMVVTEQRVKTRIVQKEVEREEEYTAFKIVPKERKIVEDCWYLEDEIAQADVECKRCMAVNLDVDSKKNMLVPIKEVDCVQCGCKTCTCTTTRLAETTKEEKKSQPSIIFTTLKKVVDYHRKAPKKHTIEKAAETVYTLQPVKLKRKVTKCVPEVIKEIVDVKVTKQMQYTYWVCEECCESDQR